MEKIINITHNQIVNDPRLLDISKESALIYNKALKVFKSYFDNGQWISKFDLQKEIFKDTNDCKRNMLSSASYIAALQQLHAAFVAIKEAKKEYAKHPEKFTGEPKYPSKEKNTNVVIFRNDTIRTKNNFLLLSLAQGFEPIKIRWNKKLGRPIYCTISWDQTKGWMGHFVFEKNIMQVENLLNDKMMGIDLGIKRIATTFDGTNCITFSGKYLRSLIRYREKSKAKYQSKMSRFEKHSRRWKRLNSSKRRKIKRISDKINDVLHKYSKTIVNYAVDNKISRIVVGDNSGTHVSPNKNKENNQLISQGVEQKLAKLIQYKFENISGSYEKKPEPYTSKTCPRCGTLNDSRKKEKKKKDGTVVVISDREYNCKHCDLKYDRDGVGSVNIWGLGKNVSLGKAVGLLGVNGSLTQPIGWTYVPDRKCRLPI